MSLIGGDYIDMTNSTWNPGLDLEQKKDINERNNNI